MSGDGANTAGLGSEPPSGAPQQLSTPCPQGADSHGSLLDRTLEILPRWLTILILFLPDFGNFSENLIKQFLSTQHTKSKNLPSHLFCQLFWENKSSSTERTEVHFITIRRHPRTEYDSQRSLSSDRHILLNNYLFCALS